MLHRSNDDSLARILLLDDDDEWRGFAHNTLQAAGFQVVVPSKVTEYCALKNLSTALPQFDLIIVDVLLEAADFVEILRRIAQLDCGGVTLALASYHTVDTITESGHAGIRNIRSKPYSRAALLEEVRAALRGIL